MKHTSLPTRQMQEQPDLEQLKRQAKELWRGFTGGEASAIEEVNAHYRNASVETFALHDAQLVVARAYGFDSWPKLKAFVDGVTIRRLVDNVQAGRLGDVEALLRARPELADMQLAYADERRPLHFAVLAHSAEMTRLLMRHGANARAGVHPYRDATEAWTMAHERGFDDIVQIIEQEEARRPKPALDETTEEPVRGDEAARAAVASGDERWLRAQFAGGGFENPIRWDGGGLLTVAVEHDRPEMLRLLLAFGFDPNEKTSIGQGDWVAYSQGMPLWNSAAEGKLELAKILLDQGADPNVQVDSAGSSVYSAFSHQQWEMVDLLVSRGGTITADTIALYRRTEMARDMLKHDPSTAQLHDLVRFGADGGAADIVRMVLERIDWPRDDERWIHIASQPLSFWHHIPWLEAGDKTLSREGYFECFQLILQRCDPNTPGGFGRTLLHGVAAMADWVTDEEAERFARALLAAGARTDLREELVGGTPLSWACRWGRLSVVRALLDYGADPIEAQETAWARPKSRAQKMGHTEIVRFLP